MKTITIISALVLLTIPAHSANKCSKQARAEMFRVYKEECNGYGGKRSCALEGSTKKNNTVTWWANCGYSSEPDYNDSAAASITFSIEDCTLIKTEVTECYTD